MSPEKMSNMKQIFNGVYAVSVLSGTIIGVGIFALPYVTLQLGFWVMLGYFVVLGVLSVMVHMCFGELSLMTPDKKRLPGFVKMYLGSFWEKIAIVSSVIGAFGAMLAYSVVGGEFLEKLLSPVFGGSSIVFILIYFFAGTILIFLGIKAIASIEFWGLILFFVALLAIFLQGKTLINNNHFFANPDWSQFFLPFGVILFSLWGTDLIPEIEEMLGSKKQMLRKVILISMLMAIVVYFFFIYVILGITGSNTTELALTGLEQVLGRGVVGWALFFGILTTFTSFITLGLTLKRTFCYDLKIKENLAWLITCFPPLVLFLFGFNNFISILSFVGGIMLGVNAILILLMYQKTTNSKLAYPLVLVFSLGILFQIIYTVK